MQVKKVYDRITFLELGDVYFLLDNCWKNAVHLARVKFFKVFTSKALKIDEARELTKLRSNFHYFSFHIDDRIIEKERHKHCFCVLSNYTFICFVSS